MDKYDPTIRYLQKLGPDHLDLIFAQSMWIFEENPRMAQRIFTADEAEVEALPRHRVAQFLERTDPLSCIAFLERVVNELGEQGPDLHDKLASLYLEEARTEASDSSGTDGTWHRKLLDFLQASEQYRPDRLLGKLSTEGEAGRLARQLRRVLTALEQNCPAREPSCWADSATTRRRCTFT